MNKNNRNIWRSTIPAVMLTASVLLILFHAPAQAASFDLNAGFGYSSSDGESENRITGESSDTSSTGHSQNYNLYFMRDFFPYLIFSGGGNFRINDTRSKIEENRTEVKRTYIRPFLELKLENPFIQTGVGYQDSEIRQKISGAQGTTNFSTTHYSFLSLRPDQLPELDLRISKTDRSNDPETTNRVEDHASLQSRYYNDGLSIDYTFTHNSDKDKLNDFRTRFKGHDAKFRHSRSHMDGKVNISTGYWIAYSQTDLQGSGNALIPQLRSAGLFSLDVTPEDGPALASIGGLIDGNTAIPTSLDIGLTGDETTLTNIGIDLGFTTRIDTVRLWVDRELTPEVSDFFTWYVYTSPDNTDTSDWHLHATVSPGDFGIFENWFEISFPEVDTQFIKIAVMPLVPSVLGASVFPNIFVTEMEVFSTLTSEDEISSLNQRLELSLGWKASKRTFLGYDWYLREQISDPGNVETVTMTNGLLVNHTFNETFTGSVRVNRRDSYATDKDTESSTYSASLKARYIETFWQTLTYSETRSYNDPGENLNRTLYLKNNAELYSGVSVYLDTGVSWGRNEDSANTSSNLVRAGSKLVPNDMVTMNLDYRANRSHVSGQETRLKENGSFKTFILPSRYLSLSARLGYDKNEEINRTTQQYNLNWTPSLGAALQFYISYDQTIQSEGNQEVKTLSPGLRWRITRHSILRAAYSVSESESNTNFSDSRSLTANLNVNL